MDEVEKLIEEGKLEEAQAVLDGIEKQNKNARWHYLQGKLFLAKNWFSEAYKQFKFAVKADPENPQYRAALQDLDNFRKSMEYKQRQKEQMGAGDTACYCCGECCLTGLCEGICDGF